MQQAQNQKINPIKYL